MKEGGERDAGEQLYAPEGDVSHAEVADGGEILGRSLELPKRSDPRVGESDLSPIEEFCCRESCRDFRDLEMDLK